MPDKPVYMVPVRSRWLSMLLLTLAALFAVWFSVVLYGEAERLGDDPGAWALLTTPQWAWIGVPLFLLVGVYFLLLLMRREIPDRTYDVPEVEAHPEGGTPSFLQGDEGATTGPGQVPEKAETAPDPPPQA